MSADDELAEAPRSPAEVAQFASAVRDERQKMTASGLVYTPAGVMALRCGQRLGGAFCLRDRGHQPPCGRAEKARRR